MVLFSFQLTAPWVFQKPFRPLTLSMIVVLPMILFAFLYLRMAKTKQVLQEESQAEAKNAPRQLFWSQLSSSEGSCCTREAKRKGRKWRKALVASRSSRELSTFSLHIAVDRVET